MQLKKQNYFIDVKIEASFNLSRGVECLELFFLKCMRNKRGNLFFQKFSYIWNEPIFLDSTVLKYFFYFFQFFFAL